MSKEETYKIMNQIKMIRRIIDFGYERALLYADIGEEEFTKTFENKTRSELIEASRGLKQKIFKAKEVSADGKFCIGKCNKQFVPKDGFVEIYCSSCDRTLAKRPIKK